MNTKQNREFFLTFQGWQKLHKAISEREQKEPLGQKFVMGDLSKQTGLHAKTVAKVLHREEGADLPTLECFFGALNVELKKDDYIKLSSNAALRKELASAAQKVWREMPDIPVFYGRSDELISLELCLVDERCRLVALLGMGGMGKTSLSVKLVERIQDKFDYFIWCSLRNAPPLKELLDTILQFLSNQQQVEADIPQDITEEIYQLIRYFREHRCLVILDNAEAVLCSGDQAGHYREGYEQYGELFRQVGEQRHQSCLLLTSREKPREIGLLEGPSQPVRSFQLSGLNEAEGREIFSRTEASAGTAHEWNALIKHYGGNPLALKIVATAIQELFDGNVARLLEYLREESLVFDDVRDLLDQQFGRLSDLEKEIMYWLAIEREPITIQQLKENILSPVSQRKLPEGLRSLQHRSLIEMSLAGFTQQPVIMEYMTDRIVEKFCEEILTNKLNLLMKYSLIKTETKDYIRESQVRLILEPIAERIRAAFNSKEDTKNSIVQLLLKLKRELSAVAGYGAGNILNLLCQLEIDITGYDFSNLTVWQAYLRDIDLHHVNFAYADLDKSTFRESFGNVFSMNFSPDGKVLAIGDTNGEIHLWQVSTFRQILTLRGHESWVWSVSFSPDGQMLASSSQDCTAKLWDIRTGQCLRTLQGSDLMRSVELSPDGKTLASGHVDSTVRLWDISTGACLKTLQGHARSVWSVSFSPDGQTLASSSDDRTVKLWDVHTGECLRTLRDHTSWVWSVSFSPDGQTLASSDDRTVKLWDVPTGECLKTLSGHTNWVRSVRFSSVRGASPEETGQTLASSSDDRTVRLWNAHTGKCLKTLQGHDYGVWSVSFNPDGQTLASSTGGDNPVVRFWDVHTGQCIKILQGYAGSVLSVRFSPVSGASPEETGRILASGSHHTVRLWEVLTGRCIHELNGHTSWVRSVNFSPDGKILASSSQDQTIKLWDVQTGLCLKTLHGHDGGVVSLSFSPDSLLLASSSEDQTVRLWDAQTGQCLKTLEGHKGWVWSVSFSPDGRTLASGSLDFTIKLWDVPTGQCLKTLDGHKGWVWSVSFSADGRTLASGSDDRTVRLWNVQDGECLKVMTGHNKGVWSTSFSPDGHTLATSSEDKTIKVWNIDTEICTKTLQGHSNGVWAVDFSPVTGHLLASGSQDETIKLWDVATGENIRTLKIDSPYEGMDITGIRGLSEAQKASLRALGAQEYSAHVQ